MTGMDKYLPTLVADSIFNFVQIIYLSVLVVIFVIVIGIDTHL